MKCKQMIGIALFLLSIDVSSEWAWAQNALFAGNTQSGRSQPVEVVVASPFMTDFERYASHTDEPLVTLTFPAVTTELDNHTSFSLTPLALAPFDAPSSLKVLAAEFYLSQSLSSGGKGSQAHAVSTVLDFDELRTFRSLLYALAATGMPRSPFADAQPVVHMASRSGVRMEFTPGPGGRIRCLVTTEIDSVHLSLDGDSATKWADAFTDAGRILDSAKESK